MKSIRIVCLGLAMLVLGLAGCGGARSPSGNDVSVSGSAPSEALAPGATVVFTMTVQNQGNNAARDVRIVDLLGSYLVLTDISCDASGGATCPETPASVMTVPTLPAGGVLIFRVSATVNVIATGTISNTMSATAADDVGRINNSATATANVVVALASLGVTQETPATTAAGSSASFKVLVLNPTGGTVANNLQLQWTASAPFALQGITYTCAAAGGAECPAAQAPSAAMSITVPTLGVGRSLTFTFAVPVPADGRGDIVSAATVAAGSDLDPTNNSSSITSRAVDARNGVYEVFAANGRAYQMDVDFDGLTYTMTGQGTTATRSLSRDGASGDHLGNTGERLRSAADLLVGTHGFAAGTLPYVAARSFASNANGLAGAFNLMARSVAADGTQPVTRAGTARVSGNALQVCFDDFEVVQASACSVGSLKNYLISFADGVFTATDSAGSGSFSFRLARSGAADILLSAGASPLGDGRQQLLIGLAENAGLVDSTVYGAGIYASGQTEWLRTELTRTTWMAEGTTIADIAGLFRIDAQSPVGMLAGAPTPTLDGAPIWVMQSYPLVVVVGATLSGSEEANASGLLQIGVP